MRVFSNDGLLFLKISPLLITKFPITRLLFKNYKFPFINKNILLFPYLLRIHPIELFLLLIDGTLFK